MSKNNAAKREAKKYRDFDDSQVPQNVVEYRNSQIPKIEPITENQQKHYSMLLHSDFVIAIGPAGVGKTWLNAATAADLYKQGHVKKLVLTRPNVEAGEKLGYLPGELEDKYAPYLEPYDQVFSQRLQGKYKSDIDKKIFPRPLAYMRGTTWDDSILLLDEAQNATVTQMKMFITRAGMNSRIFISGDVDQCDLKLKPGEINGLEWLVRRIRERGLEEDIIKYNPGEADNVRSDLCKRMMKIVVEDTDFS